MKYLTRCAAFDQASNTGVNGNSGTSGNGTSIGESITTVLVVACGVDGKGTLSADMLGIVIPGVMF